QWNRRRRRIRVGDWRRENRWRRTEDRAGRGGRGRLILRRRGSGRRAIFACGRRRGGERISLRRLGRGNDRVRLQQHRHREQKRGERTVAAGFFGFAAGVCGNERRLL